MATTYSEDDISIIDEFLAIDHIAQHLRWLVSAKLLVASVRNLRAIAHNRSADPTEVLKAIRRLYEVLGPNLTAAAVVSSVWNEWCPLHDGDGYGIDPVGDGDPMWAGDKGLVSLRYVTDQDPHEIVFHAQYVKGTE